MRLRTYLLLALTVASGTGIALFSMYADGMYSAICLFFFPFFSLLMFASVAYDIARPPVGGVVLLEEEPAGLQAMSLPVELVSTNVAATRRATTLY